MNTDAKLKYLQTNFNTQTYTDTQTHSQNRAGRALRAESKGGGVPVETRKDQIAQNSVPMQRV